MNQSIRADEDVNDYFDMMAQSLNLTFGYSLARSEELAGNITKFTDPDFVDRLGCGCKTMSFIP